MGLTFHKFNISFFSRSLEILRNIKDRCSPKLLRKSGSRNQVETMSQLLLFPWNRLAGHFTIICSTTNCLNVFVFLNQILKYSKTNIRITLKINLLQNNTSNNYQSNFAKIAKTSFVLSFAYIKILSTLTIKKD